MNIFVYKSSSYVVQNYVWHFNNWYFYRSRAEEDMDKGDSRRQEGVQMRYDNINDFKGPFALPYMQRNSMTLYVRYTNE